MTSPGNTVADSNSVTEIQEINGFTLKSCCWLRLSDRSSGRKGLFPEYLSLGEMNDDEIIGLLRDISEYCEVTAVTPRQQHPEPAA